MKVHTEEHLPQNEYQQPNPVYRFLNKWLVGKKSSDSALYSEKWQQNFSVRPTWCDADMALQQVDRGVATGNCIALYARSFFQSLLFSLGSFVQRWAWPVVIVGVALYFVCSFGLQHVRIETDIVKLWVSQGGRLDEELHFLSRVQQESQLAILRNKRHAVDPNTSLAVKPVNELRDIVVETPKENAFGSGFQVLIQTPAVKGKNALSKESLLKHVEIMEEVAKFQVEMFGENWTLSDICFKPPAPVMSTGPLSKLLTTLLDRIIPCIWITPIDCFWEGSKPLGPSPPLNFGPDAQAFVSSLPKANITWKNLDPLAVLKELSTLFDLGTIFNLFERAGVGAAYLDRWCIDPLDPECPSTAPNAFDRCSALKKFRAWNDAKPANIRIHLDVEELPTENREHDTAAELIENLFGKKRRKRQITTTTSYNASEDLNYDYYAYEDENDDDYKNSLNNNSKKEDVNEVYCTKYGKSFMIWMNQNKQLWGEFLTKNEFPFYPNYGEVMTGGCRGFARNTMIWPEDLIIGGITRQNHKLLSAEAFQSVFLVASGNDVYLRYKQPKSDLKPNLDVHLWNPYMASQVVNAWQRNFTKRIYEHQWNTEVNRQIHPLASTSLEDMLAEFSQFKFFVIFIGYLLMFVYAGWTQFSWDGWWFAVDSSVGLGILGVLLVTYASISGLGLASWMGINFNAATTQIVPFLTLGLGVDDMFLLLHNYDEVLHTVKEYEIGILMKETGMSIVITSINNIIAFMAGTLLPIPALRSFCSQTAILLSFNMVAIMVIYPALIALDLRRRKKGYRDLGCCCMESPSKNKMMGVESIVYPTSQPAFGNVALPAHMYPGPPPSLFTPSAKDTSPYRGEEEARWYTLRGFLRYYYIPFLGRPLTKMMILIMCSSMFIFGCVGLYQSVLGLELSDVLPENTAPAAFLRAREQYFSFYPMFAVLKGTQIDFPHQQEMIEEYRLDIAKSEYVIKVNGRPSEGYWMSMMREWLASIQRDLDKAISNGDIDANTGDIKLGVKIPDEARIARRLICSYGLTYNCTGRIATVKLVDDAGLINADGFYNYLTAWYNIDNMMYYVSQAAFFPTPPSWALTSVEAVVPPALPPAYSQIPFYLTDLVDTPVIVKMIREIRSVCDRYEQMGLPNFPYGITFTFWEQYLHLSWNLFVAIFVIACSVFVVISVLIFNPWAAFMVMIVVISMTIELAGFMGITGVKLNPVSAVTLVTAVGIGVEFTAHVVLAYLTSLGSKNERMAACMDHMFVPVIHGGLSTLLGIIMLAFSEFEFIVKYVFIVLSALIVIGLINGLMLLPVLLSLIGPPCEIRPKDGKKYLPVPPSLKQQRFDKHDQDEAMRIRVGGAFVEMKVNGNSKCHEAPHAFHDTLSTITEESSENQRLSSLSPLSNGNTTTKTSLDSENTAISIPVGVVAPQRSTSPLLPDDSQKLAIKPLKFTSNALRL